MACGVYLFDLGAEEEGIDCVKCSMEDVSSPVSRICEHVTFVQTSVTSKVDICTKCSISHNYIILLLATFHNRRWRGRWWWFYKANKASERDTVVGLTQLDIFQDTSSLFCGVKAGCFTWEVRPSPSVIMVTKIAILSQTMFFS